ncbi:MAG: hypothetical protein DCF15_10240 [Phormidesmis priestleyi]|uniref:Uncharacterized protein n=1 Tax=Phormidesmis priestleyi TaxID=268141 RepID=A0A2W4XHP4_9CYAN|nr:MAG: hypothetical protein DCF15_10240 [Phormidesmis priestleyi]
MFKTGQINQSSPALAPVKVPQKETGKSLDRSRVDGLNNSLPTAIILRPNRWRMMTAILARHPRILTGLVLLAIASSTSAFLGYQLFKGALTYHRDNLAILRTLLKMELAQASALPLENDPQQLITRTYSTLEPHLEADGWQWVNRFGSTSTYAKQNQTKQNQQLIVSCSSYSPLYLICNISEIP